MKSSGLLLFFILTACAHTALPASCVSHPEKQVQVSARLRQLVNEDQTDRKGNFDQLNWNLVSPRDLQRRLEVAQAFAESCLQNAEDYAAAAMIYQHGDSPSHFLQAFLWAKKAVELGDEKQKWLMGASLDRYLVKSGKKQLFATQWSKDPGDACFCFEPVEPSFPESRRVAIVKKTLSESLENEKSFSAHPCHPVKICEHTLLDSGVGTIPGFW